MRNFTLHQPRLQGTYNQPNVFLHKDFFRSLDILTQITGHPGYYLQKKAPCMNFLSGTSRAGFRDIPTYGSLMSQEYPAQKIYLWGVLFDEMWGQILYTPTPPTPENTLLGVGGCRKGGGRIKFLPRGASKYTPPSPSPEKCLLARNGGRGGGCIISLWTKLPEELPHPFRSYGGQGRTLGDCCSSPTQVCKTLSLGTM